VAKFLKKRHRKKHDDDRWSAGPRSFEAGQRAGHIITGSSHCLSPGRAIEKPAHLNQDVESWQYFLKIWIFHFFENGFLVVPGENLAHQRHFELCRTELSFLAFACC